jgi:hypothetical protein
MEMEMRVESADRFAHFQQPGVARSWLRSDPLAGDNLAALYGLCKKWSSEKILNTRAITATKIWYTKENNGRSTIPGTLLELSPAGPL